MPRPLAYTLYATSFVHSVVFGIKHHQPGPMLCTFIVLVSSLLFFFLLRRIFGAQLVGYSSLFFFLVVYFELYFERFSSIIRQTETHHDSQMPHDWRTHVVKWCGDGGGCRISISVKIHTHKKSRQVRRRSILL